jgi:hypothetical protein
MNPKFHIVERNDLVFMGLVLMILDMPKTVRDPSDADVIICNSWTKLQEMHEDYPNKLCILYASAYGDTELPENCFYISGYEPEKLSRLATMSVEEIRLAFPVSKEIDGRVCMLKY